jgi:hypothetical protein
MDNNHAPVPETNRSLPIALLRAREKVMGPIRAMLADVGVTEQQWRVLRVLAERGTLDPTEIADRSCLLMPSLTRILQTLTGQRADQPRGAPHGPAATTGDDYTRRGVS